MWHILEDEYFAKKLRKLRSNTEVINRYREASFDLTHSASPEARGDRKRGRLQHSYVYRITKSYRLVYRVDRGKEEIVMVDLDDHKNIYGRD